MELDHVSHPDHKLSYRKSVKWDEEDKDCAACSGQISSQHYCCSECNFFLHKLCAERPQELTHSLHPLHPLRLLHKPYEGIGGAECDACMKGIKGFSYHCATCKFDLHFVCAFPDEFKVNHMSHPEHVLTLEKAVKRSNKGVVCVACLDEISGQSAEHYSCRRCNVFLHKVCSEAPPEFTYSSHNHPLQLIPGIFYFGENPPTCRACDDDVLNGLLYDCNICRRFTIHLRCADLHSKLDYSVLPCETKLNHVCHRHILNLEKVVKRRDWFVQHVSKA